jgi:hypothetical protein
MIDDARKLPAQMLPKPRTERPATGSIDLTRPELRLPKPAREVRIPDAVSSLVDGYDLGT